MTETPARYWGKYRGTVSNNVDPMKIGLRYQDGEVDRQNWRAGQVAWSPAGKLHTGDILIAIDGVLITTRDGGRRLANLRPGVPITLRIRRDGKEIGRYRKVCPTWGEGGSRQRGTSFPVFPTPDLGTVGMLICYDKSFPESCRELALRGADLFVMSTAWPMMPGHGDGEDNFWVRQYDAFASMLKANLGVDPTRSLQSLLHPCR